MTPLDYVRMWSKKSLSFANVMADVFHSMISLTLIIENWYSNSWVERGK
jgi:protein gp37